MRSFVFQSGIVFAYLGLASPLSAQAPNFSQKDICVVRPGQPSVVNAKEILKLATAGAKDSDIDKNGDETHSRQERIDYAANEPRVLYFLLSPDPNYYSVKRKGGGEPQVREFLDHPDRYEVLCVRWPRTDSATEFRASIDTAAKKAETSVILRKDVDNLSVGLKKAQPAKFSAARDGVADNSIVQSELAIGTEYTIHLGEELNPDGVVQETIPLVLRPYTRYVGKFNSKRGPQDVDSLGFGLMADLYRLELLGVSNKVSLRGEYLTDAEARSEIAAGEVVWSPHFRDSVLRRLLPLGERVPLVGGDEGIFIRLDLSGRYRFGEVFDAGDAVNLATTKEYSRFGGRGRVELGIGGTDVLSGMTLFADYLYFNDLHDDNPLDEFYKFEAGLSYAFTENVGVSLGYVRGRDEDKLQEIDRVEGNLTVKWGKPED